MSLFLNFIEPPIEVSYKPYEGSMDKIFALVQLDDGMFEIRAVKE